MRVEEHQERRLAAGPLAGRRPGDRRGAVGGKDVRVSRDGQTAAGGRRRAAAGDVDGEDAVMNGGDCVPSITLFSDDDALAFLENTPVVSALFRGEAMIG